MIYFLHGADIDKARTKANELIESLRKKKPDASFFKIDSENFDVSILQEYIGGQGLFSNKYIVYLDRLCEKKEVKEEFIEKIKEISESENIFIVLEGKIDKATVTKIEKKAEKTQDFELSEKKEKVFYNAFALADAFAQGNKKDAWILYRKAIDRGEAPEALHGMLFWKIKTMILNNPSNKNELLSLADKLITIYHDSRRGEHELETRLEAFLLNLN
jgi:DNA polymerase III delta subunit